MMNYCWILFGEDWQKESNDKKVLKCYQILDNKKVSERIREWERENEQRHEKDEKERTGRERKRKRERNKSKKTKKLI